MHRDHPRRPRLFVLALSLVVCLLAPGHAGSPALAADARDQLRTIVLIGGPPDGHPPTTHEYARSVMLFKYALEASPSLDAEAFDVVAFPQGWPEDAAALDEADTLVFITSGSDHVESNQPMLVGDRMQQLQRHMDRGCGIVTIHYATFAPIRVSEQILEWVGGHFDYESGRDGEPGWYSAIQHYEAPVTLPQPTHPVARGVSPFTLREEFYYRIRFREGDERLTPVLQSQPPGELQPQTVAWAVERADGGRGFGLTGGHYYHNWWIADYRRLALNAIVWTAGLEVPADGVADPLGDEPLRVLILTGHHHPGHDWRTLTAALQEEIHRDPRTQVEVWEDIEQLAQQSLEPYDALVMNYNNWEREGLSESARQRFQQYIAGGGGLSVIHFANGAFHFSLPGPSDSDWPEYRRIVRRVWDHDGDSGHDPFGPFAVEITDVKHPITHGLSDFETVDELYFNQAGDEPIEPLATAHSNVTGRDEPMAWVYGYHDGRVFQTVLGHDAPAVRDAGALIRRGTIWAADAEQLTFEPRDYRRVAAADGQFGPALDARRSGATVPADDAFALPPITVEAWVRLESAAGFNIIVSSEDKASATHWELYSYAGDGTLAAYLPGYQPAEIRSTAAIADGQWHHVGFSFGEDRVRLYVDGEQVADQPVAKQAGGERLPGPLMIGHARHGEGRIGCLGYIEQVRIRRGAHHVTKPDGLMNVADDTLGLWRFDAINNGRARNAADDAHAATVE